jgi:RNA polymerase sigma factor (sigma-70 family)
MSTTLELISPVEKWPDDNIKSLAQTNPQQAMASIIKKYREPLLYHAICIVKDEDEAYDLVQEVFIRAIRESRLFTFDFRIKAWLYRVTTNLCFNNVRNRKRRAAILEAKMVTELKESDQIRQIFEGQRQQEILRSIAKLTEDHQKILMLRYYDDFSYAEIADVLNIKLGTVMSRLSRARNRLLAVIDQGLCQTN